VAKGVVDGLEAVEVDEQHADHSTGALECGDGLFEAIDQQLPVGKAREAVVEREVA
jgi:hypothetical protein